MFQLIELIPKIEAFSKDTELVSGFYDFLGNAYYKAGINSKCANINLCQILEDNTQTVKNTVLAPLPFSIPLADSYDYYGFTKGFAQIDNYGEIPVLNNLINPLLNISESYYKVCDGPICWNLTGMQILNSKDLRIIKAFSNVTDNVQKIIDGNLKNAISVLTPLSNYTDLDVPGGVFKLPNYSNWPKIHFKYKEEMRKCMNDVIGFQEY